MKGLPDWVDGFAPAAGPPPDRLFAFLRWSLGGRRGGAFPAIGAMLAISVVTGVSEVVGAQVVGWVIDLAQARGPEALFSEIWHLLLLAAGFFLVFRPAALGAGAAVTALALQPKSLSAGPVAAEPPCHRPVAQLFRR